MSSSKYATSAELWLIASLILVNLALAAFSHSGMHEKLDAICEAIPECAADSRPTEGM